MRTEPIEDALADLLPGHGAEAIADAAQGVAKAEEAKALAKARALERRRLRALERRAETSPSDTRLQAEAEAQARRVEAVEVLQAEAEAPLQAEGRSARGAAAAVALQGTSRPEVTRLLQSLGVNLSVQLTRSDTANLLATLLTCNETQLRALLDDRRVPVVIRTVIRRLLDDMRVGSMDTVERLWDRVFGKGPMQLGMPEGVETRRGLLPDQPVSREAYIVIRDTLMR